MDAVHEQETPRLAAAGPDGCSLQTVEYKGRFLYSKHNPARTAEAAIERLELLPGTLVIICSPVLWHGFQKLQSSLPDSCRLLALENDENLFSMAKKFMPENAGISFFNLKEAPEIDFFVRQACKSGKIKRAARIDFSAGTQFSREQFDFTVNSIQEIIGTFWKNRVTLVKTGRLFSRNLFRNLREMKNGFLLEEVQQSVSKPIIVCGAGEGLDTLPYGTFRTEDFFILAVDAALPSLAKRGITPDAAVAMECRLAIEKSYIGLKGKKITLFADLCSRNEVTKILGGTTVYFASQYSDGVFFERLKQSGLIKHFVPPMGSVGLAAVYIALKLRCSEQVPVFAAGLDFSHSAGATHAKGTEAHTEQLKKASRTASVENYEAAFCPASQSVAAKNGKTIRSTKLLLSYAAQFRLMFESQRNLFDCAETGISIGIGRNALFLPKAQPEIPAGKKLRPGATASAAERFCENEKEALAKMRDLLVNGEKSRFRQDGIPLEAQIAQLLAGREYLFLHFPDGYEARTDISFLKRIRAETDFFLKQLAIPRKQGSKL